MNTSIRQTLPSASFKTGRQLRSLVVAVAVVVAIGFGFSIRELRLINAETGLGYTLGIIGGSMMLLLLLYPLRKRLRQMARWGSMRQWYRMHSALGLVAPVLILYHANFELGSTNSTIALFSMLVVASSGVIGRYLYARVGYGAHESRSRLAELQSSARGRLRALDALLVTNTNLDDLLNRYARAALSDERGAVREVVYVVGLGARTRREKKLAHALTRASIDFVADKQQWHAATKADRLRQAENDLRIYFDAALRAGEFASYSRLFALWHQLHLPLFLMLVLTGVAHVFAVHLY